MRTGKGIAVVVAIGLIWSVAVMSQCVLVASPEMKSATLIEPHKAKRQMTVASFHSVIWS